MRDGSPHPPREYRTARRRARLLAALAASALSLAVAASAWPVVSSGLLLIGLALTFAAMAVHEPPLADRPDTANSP